MSGQYKPRVAGTPAPAARHAHADLADLMAFIRGQPLTGGLALLAFAGAPGWWPPAGPSGGGYVASSLLRRWRRMPASPDLPVPAPVSFCVAARRTRVIKRALEERPDRLTCTHLNRNSVKVGNMKQWEAVP